MLFYDILRVKEYSCALTQHDFIMGWMIDKSERNKCPSVAGFTNPLACSKAIWSLTQLPNSQ